MRLVLVTVLLGVAAAMSPAFAQQATPALSSIRVSGEAKVTAQPDRVQIDVGVSTRATLSAEAAAQNAREVDAVLTAVRKAAGPTAVLKTVSYSVNPNYQHHPNGVEPTITGYTAANVVQVQLDELARIGAVIDGATQSGANRIEGIQFTLRDQDAVRAQALRDAARRAHAEAEVLAGALGLKIVRVISVEEVSPRVMPLRTYAAMARSAAAEVATPVEAGTLDITADVTLTVEVAPAAR